MRTVFIFILLISFPLKSAVIFSDKENFINSFSGGSLIEENWQSYSVDTPLANQTVNGITYNTPNLLVGARRGPNWIIGFEGSSPGRYRSFSSTILDIDITDSSSAFGVSISQGNQNNGIRREGTSKWEITFDDVDIYDVTINTTSDDFSGEAFFGIRGLAYTNVKIRRVFSDIGIVWNVRDISYANAVNAPASAMLLLIAFSALTLRRANI